VLEQLRPGDTLARRHRVGKAHAKFVIDSVVPDHVLMTATADARLVWIGSAKTIEASRSRS